MEGKLLAGTGRADITCEAGARIGDLLSAKARPHIPPEFLDKRIAIDDPLYARALVLDDGERRLALVTMDVTAVGARTVSGHILDDSADDFVPALRARIESETGIPGECVSVCASHTHPPGRLLCSDRLQLERTAAAVRRAVETMAPAVAGAGAGREERLTFNRTLMMRDGTDYTIRSCNPFPPDEAVAALRPVDPEVGVLRVDRLDGRPLAVVYNFASHLLIGSPRDNITAGFPVFVSRCLEKHLGGEVTAFFVQGAFGDVAEVSKTDPDHPRDNRLFGETLGLAVLEAWRGITPGPARLRAASLAVDFPLRGDIPALISGLRREQGRLCASLRYTGLNFKTFLPLYLKHRLFPGFPAHAAYRYLQADLTGDEGFRALDRRNRLAVDKYLEGLAAMERMARNEEKIATLAKHAEIIETLGGKSVSAEVQGFRVGEAVFIAAPMEILAETGLKTKKASPFRHTFIASIANGYLHYAPPDDYYPRGGYEATECLLGPAWEKIFASAAGELFGRLAG